MCRVYARDTDLSPAQKFTFIVAYVLHDLHAGPSLPHKLYTHAQDVVEAPRSEEIHMGACHYEHEAELASERLLCSAQAAQPLGPRAFHKAQVACMVNNAAIVGVLVIDTNPPVESGVWDPPILERGLCQVSQLNVARKTDRLTPVWSRLLAATTQSVAMCCAWPCGRAVYA